MKLLRAMLQETMESVDGSSTISKVLVRNGGGPISCRPSMGRGDKLEDEDDEPAAHVTVSSSFTLIPSIPHRSKPQLAEQNQKECRAEEEVVVAAGFVG